MIKLDAVAAFASQLPGVTVGAKWGRRTWMVGDHGFAWERAFSKADLARFGAATPPAGDIVAIMVESLDAKDALLAIGPRGFFTIPHFNGYPAVLIALRAARAADVRAATKEAWRVATSAKPRRAAKRAPKRSR